MSELEDRWGDLGAFIREQRRLGELSLRKLSELAGVSNPYLSQIERGLRKPSAEILRQIAQALHLSAETLYVRAGILDEVPGVVDLVGEIRRDPHLDEEQKRALVHIYRSFRSAGGPPAASASASEAADERDGDGDGPAAPVPDRIPPSVALADGREGLVGTVEAGPV
jgi:transcriptional regulator with XRE-family HTH domain